MSTAPRSAPSGWTNTSRTENHKNSNRNRSGRLLMSHAHRARIALAFAVGAAFVLSGVAAYTQTMAPTNSAPNPYRSIENWAKLPDGRTWGSTSAVDIDVDGSSVWVGERCGAQGFVPASQMKEGVPFNCDGSKLAPIFKFDASGKLVKSFGEEL